MKEAASSVATTVVFVMSATVTFTDTATLKSASGGNGCPVAALTIVTTGLLLSSMKWNGPMGATLPPASVAVALMT